jgi:hypothetical protein
LTWSPIAAGLKVYQNRRINLNTSFPTLQADTADLALGERTHDTCQFPLPRIALANNSKPYTAKQDAPADADKPRR